MKQILPFEVYKDMISRVAGLLEIEYSTSAKQVIAYCEQEIQLLDKEDNHFAQYYYGIITIAKAAVEAEEGL